jgi:hypothetical protein
MNKEQFFEGIASALGVDGSLVTFESSQDDFEEWDSLGHLSILQLLDEKTDGGLDRVSGVASMTTVLEIWNAMVTAGICIED